LEFRGLVVALGVEYVYYDASIMLNGLGVVRKRDFFTI